jgi:hypothetical protein
MVSPASLMMDGIEGQCNKDTDTGQIGGVNIDCGDNVRAQALCRPCQARLSESGSSPGAPAVGYGISSLRDFRQQIVLLQFTHVPVT